MTIDASERKYRSAVTIPSNSFAQAVTTGSVAIDLSDFGAIAEVTEPGELPEDPPVVTQPYVAGVDLRGKWVTLYASGGNITILRNGGETVTAGQGLYIASGTYSVRLWVDPQDEAGASVIGSTSCNLVAIYSSDEE